jgi:flagellar protein FliO/FliZ
MLRSVQGLIQKVTLSGFAVAILFMMVIGIPASVAAEEPNVMDWLEEEQPEPDGQIVEENEPETNAGLNETNEKSPMLLIGQLIFYTLLIIIMIYALIKFLASRQKKLNPNQAIQLVGGTALGNNKSLQLVKVGGKIYLLGVADQITLIKEFASEDELDLSGGNQGKSALFASSLLGLTKKQSDSQSKGQFEQLFTQSLDKQKEKQNQLRSELFQNDEEGRDKQ